GAPREPSIEQYEATDAVYNDPGLAKTLRETLEHSLGQANVQTMEPLMSSEDFSYFIAAGIPSFFFGLGGPNPQQLAEAQAKGEWLPSIHSAYFAPDLEPALRTAIQAETAVLRRLLR